MLSLFFRNLFFTLIHPGLVAGLIPFWILGDKIYAAVDYPFHFFQFLGLPIFFIGLAILLYCIYKFAVVGRGTLSPADPTQQLVTTGLYQFTRNPMYVGVLMILSGEVIFFQSYGLLAYSVFIFLLFNFFIYVIEEPRLRKDFGEPYLDYCQQVRRWV